MRAMIAAAAAASGKARPPGRRPRMDAGNSRASRRCWTWSRSDEPPASIASAMTARIASARRSRALAWSCPAGWRSCPAARRGDRPRPPQRLARHRYCRARRSAAGRAAPPSAASRGREAGRRSVSPSSALPVGSTPSPASIGCSSGAPSRQSSMKPKRRGSLKMMRARLAVGRIDDETRHGRARQSFERS